MHTHHRIIAVLATAILTQAAQAADTYDRAGWVATLPLGFHDVEGRATIIDERNILVENFNFDGSGPAVYFYLGGNNTHDAFVNGQAIGPHLTRPYDDETIMLTLPEGDSMDRFSALSVWCVDFQVSFSSAVFRLEHPADVDDDGDLDADDYAYFADCLAGPDSDPNASMTSVQDCLDAFDHDGDEDIDTLDFQAFQATFTAPPSPSAMYELTFASTWSADTHPSDFPSNPHFSGLIGGTHDETVAFWTVGQLASEGIERMAETGNKTILQEEVEAQIANGHAEYVLSGGGIGTSPGTRVFTFTISQDYQLATIVSMIAPSPDWFVGVDSLDLFHDNQWTPELIIPLEPYDSGTDSGDTYSTPNVDTVPPEPIFVIEGYPFETEGTQPPLGTFTFRRMY